MSRTTVREAFDELVGDGWAVRRDRARAVAALPRHAAQPLAPMPAAPTGGPGGAELDLRSARIAAPADAVVDALDRARSRLTAHLLGDGRLPAGLPELRAAIAERFSAQGLATTPEQVLVTNGAMGALDALLGATRGAIVVEDPTYHVALRLMAGRRRRLVGWGRGERWDTDELDHLQRQHRPGLVYVVADFHNPTGRLATAAERRDLAAVTAKHDAVVVVDETLRDLDLRPGSPRRVAPTGLHAAHAVTIGGLSKSVWSGLRVGWARVPDAALRDALRQATDVQPVPLLDQLVAVELWSQLDEIVGERRRRLARQRDVLVRCCRDAGFDVRVPEGGLACWIDLGRPVASRLASLAGARGVLVAPGAMFSATSTLERFVRVPFTHDEATLARAVDLLAELVAAP